MYPPVCAMTTKGVFGLESNRPFRVALRIAQYLDIGTPAAGPADLRPMLFVSRAGKADR